ncbi:MAG: SAP domain-containing protein [Candidatus Poseidoniaceae archaeon]|nr:SAP domain-containing protein [Candidatus Poseidoniaceae archaeon]
MGYTDMTLLELKVLCKERGLMVSGKKDDVIIRLMENDEAIAPPNQVISNNSNQYIHHNSHQVPLSNDKDVLMILLGVGIIIYSLFRIWTGFLFLSVGSQVLASLIAIVIGFAFMTGGILTTMNYKNGLVITLLVLLFSGLLSLVATSIFGGITPLSVDFGDDEFTKTISLMCSTTCLVIVGVPFLINMDSMKPGFPPGLEDIFSSQRSTNNSNQSVSKISYECPSCSQTLRIPSTYSGIATCPKCKEQMEI